MIDTATEAVLTLAQAAAELPRRRRGRKTHVSTLYRWTVSGCRGIILESIQIGATRATSREALQRFFDACPNRTGSETLRPLGPRINDNARAKPLADSLKNLGPETLTAAWARGDRRPSSILKGHRNGIPI